MKKISAVGKIFFLGFVISMLVACGESISETVIPSLTVMASTESVSEIVKATPRNPTSTPLPTSTVSITSTPTSTVEPTYQAWYSTAIAVRVTANAIRQQVRDADETKVAQFPIACADDSSPSGKLSPNGEWLASSCGTKREQTLIVQNKDGTKWVLKFKDFLGHDAPDGLPGILFPISWSPDGEYLYFSSEIGYSGGGNDCFPGFGYYSLSRLNLETGSWVNLIPPTDSFPGYEIMFSPTGRRYATDMDGITITDLQTGEVVKLNASGVMDLLWSPDGTHLVYSVASCGEQSVETSAVYIWDALKNQSQIVYMTDEILLRPESWIDDSTLRIIGEKYVSTGAFYTIYVYNLEQGKITFTGTATPYP